MKRVSFEVAKAIKDAGYPQDCDMWYPVPPKYQNIGRKVAQPTYMEVWLWLWREKDIDISIDHSISNRTMAYIRCESQLFEKKDPEEAIINAIEYLVKHNLIK